MDVVQSYEYLLVKSQGTRLGDRQNAYHTGMNQFLNDKSYRPTFESFATERPRGA